jgi:mono/diheme cytochrome c family protein
MNALIDTRRMRIVFALLLASFILGSCSEDQPTETPPPTKAKPEYPVAKTKMVYSGMCALCHGLDGKLAVAGAKDLSQSTLTLEERIVMITDGKGAMTPFKDRLTEEQIRHLAMYVESLREQ